MYELNDINRRLVRHVANTICVVAFALVLSSGAAIAQQPAGDDVSRYQIDDKFELGERRPFAGKSGYSDASICRDKNLVAFVSYVGDVTVWDIDSEKKIAEFQLNSQSASCVDISRDGKLVAAGSGITGKVRIWNLAAEELVSEFDGLPGYKENSTYHPAAILFSDDADHLVCKCVDQTTRVWNARDGSVVCSFKVASRGGMWHLDVAGNSVYSSGNMGQIVEHHLQSGELVSKSSRMGASAMAALPDGRVVIASHRGVYLRDRLDQRGNQLDGEAAKSSSFNVAVSPDGTQFVSATYSQQPPDSDGRVRRTVFQLQVFDLGSGELETTFNIPSWPQKLAFTADGDSVVCYSSALDGIELYDLATGQSRFSDYEGHAGPVMRLGFVDDGDRLFSYGQDGTALIWDLDSKQEELRTEQLSSQALEPRPDGRSVAFVRGLSTIHLVDLEREEVSAEFEIKKPSNRQGFFAFNKALKSTFSFTGRAGPMNVRTIRFSPDGDEMMAYSVGYPNQIQFSRWDADSEDVLLNRRFSVSELSGGSDMSKNASLFHIRFSPDGKLAAFQLSKKLFLFDLQSDQLNSFSAPNNFNLGPFVRGGTHLLTQEKGKLRTWDVKTGENETVDIDDSKGSVRCHAASKHVALFASYPSGENPRIQLRRTSDWKLVLDEELEKGTNFRAYAISPNGRRLALGRPDGVIEIWLLAKE